MLAGPRGASVSSGGAELMDVVVMVEQHARPGLADALGDSAQRQLAAPAEGRHRARVFQAIVDPHYFLVVGEWESRAAFEEHRRQSAGEATEALLVSGPAVHYYRPLASFESPAGRATVFASAAVEAEPGASREAVLDALLALVEREMQARFPSRVYAIYEDLERPGAFVVLEGWEPRDAHQQFRGDRETLLRTALQQRGASFTRFAWHLRAETPAASTARGVVMPSP